jgi:NitT/TauT family transport system substrate-binding protein
MERCVIWEISPSLFFKRGNSVSWGVKLRPLANGDQGWFQPQFFDDCGNSAPGLMMQRGLKEILIVVILLILSGIGRSYAAERPLRVAYPAPAAAFLPLWAAQDAGVFKKHGLFVELIAVGSSTRGIAALLSGYLDVLAGGGTGGVTTQAQGYTDMALFANLIQTFLFSVFAQPSITDVSQLRGKRMGVTRFGGTLDFAARQYVKRHGLEPGRDITFVQIGAMPDIVVAVATGAIESGVIGVPQNFLAKKQGLRELADLSESGARYALAAFLAKRSFLSENHEPMVRFMKALVEAIYHLKNHPKEGMEIMKRYTRIDAADILKPAYDLHVKLFPKVPEIFPEDVKLVLEEVALTNPKAKGANPGTFIDGSIAKEVIASGFADQLYR